MAKKPGIEEIKAIKTKCEELYNKTFNQFRRAEQLYECDFKNELNISKEIQAQGWHGVVLPTGRDAIDTAVAHTNLFNAEVHVNRKGTSEAAKEAQRLEKAFYYGVIYNTQMESSISPWVIGGKHFWLYGRAVFRTTWDADMWMDKPLQKAGESDEDYRTRLAEWRDSTYQRLPLKIEAVNPTCIMTDPSYGEERYVFEVHTKMVFDTKKMYPKWGNPLKREITESAEYVIYFDKDYRCDLIDGEPVIPVQGGVAKHQYGFIPYTCIDSNLGNVSWDNALEKRFVGLLNKIDDVLVAESRAYSIRDVVLAKTAYPTRHMEGDTDGVVNAKYEDKFGVVNTLPPGVKLVNDSPQVPPDALNYHLSDTSAIIAAHAAPRSAQGLSEQGVRSAVDRQLIASQAAARYAYSSPAFAMGTAKLLTNCARIIKNVVKENVRVWSRTPSGEFDVIIDPTKLVEPFTCSVEFSPISEDDEYKRDDGYLRLLAGGVVTKPWVRERKANVDPDAMEIDEAVERLKNDPLLQQITSQYLASKMANAIATKEAAEQVKNPGAMMPTQGMAGAGMGGQLPVRGQPPQMPQGNRMMPPSSPKPVPGSPQALQNELRGMRRQKSTTMQGVGGGGNNGGLNNG